MTTRGSSRSDFGGGRGIDIEVPPLALTGLLAKPHTDEPIPLRWPSEVTSVASACGPHHRPPDGCSGPGASTRRRYTLTGQFAGNGVQALAGRPHLGDQRKNAGAEGVGLLAIGRGAYPAVRHRPATIFARLRSPCLALVRSL